MNRIDGLSKGKNGLARDQRGAIMVIGLFAALSLVGALWMMIGIGEAIVIRDRGQEAADAAALSSAAVHARAMNATAAMNFVMLVMVGAYVAFCVIADLLLTIAATILLDPRELSAGLAVGANAQRAYQSLIRFEQGMGQTFSAIDKAQSGLAVGAPSLGTRIGQDAASHYKYDGMTLGWSNFPSKAIARKAPLETGAVAGAPIEPGGKANAPPCFRGNFVCDMANVFFPVLTSPPPFIAQEDLGGSLGLPFAPEPTKALCVRTTGVMFDSLPSLVQWLDPPSGIALHTLRAIGGQEVKLPLAVHCNDSINQSIVAPQLAKTGRGRNVWSERGPKRMTAPNGGLAMQVLAWSVSPEPIADTSVRRVKLGAFRVTRTQSKAPETASLVYDAQAEFFYNCDKGWLAPSCNNGQIGPSGVGHEHALYWMKWRARLTRAKGPQTIFGDKLGAVINGGGAVAAGAGVPQTVWPRVREHLTSPPAGPRNLH